ncbi:ParB N-terminal domain-containing protein [Mesorhizobium sp.]|uniref:ParB N-terminal domain-containing protein n=1 Tax=Mesorhizobium sp. TaxID=1871066 RepID=UPI00120A9856|nr:ParB N-terminal domain-containing protein [Mesorhizobium sp.]TIX28839.1 MAG: chromosome partitioning protein ParB [Mesorhizobium sp.]
MNSEVRTIDPTPFAAAFGRPLTSSLGIKPGLCWLPISSLRIDPAYQREIFEGGAKNVLKIAKGFDWALFGVVVCANIGQGLFAIVDGQHRVLAAALRAIEEVPCIIIEADPKKQAEAFAAINGAVTAIHPLSIFAAEIAGNKPDAIALRDACSKADVNILRYPVPSKNMKLGDTIAIRSLQECMRTYGADHLSLALRAITRARPDGNVGHVKAPIIKALCHVLDAEKSWCKPEYRLISVMGAFDYGAELDQASVLARKNKRQTHTELAVRLFDYLDDEIGA